MIGQDRLKTKLFSYDVNTLPHAIMLRGEDGCGKHVLANEIAERLSLEIVDITDSLNYDTLSDIYATALTKIYLVDLSGTNERQQNVILKFLEEPRSNAFVFVLTEPNGFVLQTVRNRCVVFDFDRYTDDELLAFQTQDRDFSESLRYCRTPGRLLNVNEKTIAPCHELCVNVVSRLKTARLPNALTIAKKINCKDEFDKFDFDVFLEMLTEQAYLGVVEGTRDSSMYDIIREERNKLHEYAPNRETFLEHLTLRLWANERKTNDVRR